MSRSARNRTRLWSGAFLKALAKEGNIAEACRKAKIGRRTAYDLREQDEQFRTVWDEAIEQAADQLELIAIRRAKKKSDRLLLALLAAHRPEKYRTNYHVEHTATMRLEIAEEIVDAPSDTAKDHSPAPRAG